MDIFTEWEGRKLNVRLCEEEDKTPIHLIYDCPRTRIGMDELILETRERKKTLEEFLLNSYDYLSKFNLF
ncbi:Hypothetical protein FKW44_012664 [Caligus rogercresseyi]|uniref:Uncharacterized protein n=1 Tax=Caligus rogercresseyi TaxID=217165 RepID=A0A7T8K9Q1_CALRO|nr:Hypothetical protein FKW44_012664 [Caligus rogercresseyi]